MMKSRIGILKETPELFVMKYNPKARSDVMTEQDTFKNISLRRYIP